MAKYAQITRVQRSEDANRAFSQYYERLADHFVRQLGSRSFRVILEAGCGKGQLTIPFAKRMPRGTRIIAVDSSRGPYSGWFGELTSRIAQAGLSRRIRCIKSDVRRMREVRDVSVDLVISNELLCDLLDPAQLERALKEFYRILRPSGLMIHGEWVSSPANESQALTMKADTPLGTDTPSMFWNPDQLVASMSKIGFGDFRVSYFETTVRFDYDAAVRTLQGWDVKESFLRRHDRLLRRYGIEVPPEHLIRCRKWTDLQASSREACSA